MKQTITTLLLLFASLMGFAKPYTVNNLPVSTQYIDSLDFNAVCNPDGILTSTEVDSLNQILWKLHETQRVQGLVIAIKEADPDDPYQFCIDVGRKYGVGGKASLGFIVMVTSVQRGYEIMTGDGMEKYLTDADCSIIGRKLMVPYFKEGKWGAGILAAVKTIDGVCKGEVELNAAPDSNGNSEDGVGLGTILLWIFGPFAGLGALGYYYNRKAKTCPKCKKLNYGRTKRVVSLVEGGYDADALASIDGMTFKLNEQAHNMPAIYQLQDGIKAPVDVVDYYECPDCGYVHEKKFLSNSDKYMIGTFNGTGDRAWGEIISAAAAAGAAAASSRDFRDHDHGSHHSSHHSSGPSFHSTFGGGHFSGGGAGGRF